MNWELTDEQDQAVAMAVWLSECAKKGEPKVGLLKGPAGSGKTYVLKAALAALGEMPELLAPIGRAALRLAEVTDFPARTMHSYLYIPDMEKLADGDVEFVLREDEKLGRNAAKLFIVDECSLASPKPYSDLRFKIAVALGYSILFVGDENQLPPVLGDSDANFSIWEEEFDRVVELTKIQRQALDSPIIRASIKIREGFVLEGLSELPHVPRVKLVDACAETYDQGGGIICYTNKMRHDLNQRIRAAFGIQGPVTTHEPIMALKNDAFLGVYNGQVFPFDAWLTQGSQDEVYDRWSGEVFKVWFAAARIGGKPVIVCIDQLMGLSGKIKDFQLSRASKTWAQKNAAGFAHQATGELIPYAFMPANLGWSMTAHKAQGSEWPRVTVVVEGACRFNERFGQQWLYTAVTRGKESVNYSRGGGEIGMARRQRVLKPKTSATAMKVLVLNDPTTLVSIAAEKLAPGQMAFCTDPLVEQLTMTDADADYAVGQYDGFIVCTDEAYPHELPKACQLIGDAALRAKKTAILYNHYNAAFAAYAEKQS